MLMYFLNLFLSCVKNCSVLDNFSCGVQWNVMLQIWRAWSWSWSLNTDSGLTTNEQTIANTFNVFFVSKIQKLKEGIDKKYVEDPINSVTPK